MGYIDFALMSLQKMQVYVITKITYLGIASFFNNDTGFHLFICAS